MTTQQSKVRIMAEFADRNTHLFNLVWTGNKPDDSEQMPSESQFLVAGRELIRIAELIMDIRINSKQQLGPYLSELQKAYNKEPNSPVATSQPPTLNPVADGERQI